MKKENKNPLIKGGFLLLLFILSNYCNAQLYRIDGFYEDPVWGRLDTLYNQNYEPIALLGQRRNIYDFWKQDFAVFNFQKEILLTASYRKQLPIPQCHWDFHFSSNNHLTITRVNASYYNKKNLLKILDDYKMVQDGKIDPEAEKSFILHNQGTYVAMYNVQDTTVTLPTIESDNNNIRVENKVIGKFHIKYDQADSTKLFSINVYNFIDGSKVAEAFPPIGDSREWTVTTFSDNKTQNLFYYSENNLEQLFTFLLKNEYLKLK